MSQALNVSPWSCICLSLQRETGQANHAKGPGAVPGTVRGGCPDILLRRFDVYFTPRTKMAPQPMRAVRATHLGHLVRVRVGSCGRTCDCRPVTLRL